MGEEQRSVVLPNDMQIPVNYREPETVQQALNCPMFGNNWISAMIKEMQQIHNTKTLELIKKDEVLNLNYGRFLGSKWVFNSSCLNNQIVLKYD